MSKKTDKAYEKIIRAFGSESPDEQFDKFGDDDKNDIDKNFEKPEPEAEGKDWSDWDTEKEPDTAHEDLLPVEEERATNPQDNYSEEPETMAVEDVNLPVIEDDDDLENEWTADLADQEREEFEGGIAAQKYEDELGESFKDDELKNINEIFSDKKDYDGVFNNTWEKGVSTGKRADDVSSSTDDEGYDQGDISAGNALTKVGQNQEPNKELGSRKVQLAKETGYMMMDGVGEGYEDDMLDQKNEDKKMDQEWDNYVERDVGGEDPEEDKAEELQFDEDGNYVNKMVWDKEHPKDEDAEEKEGGIPSELLEQRHNEEIEASGHPENWTLSGEPRQIGAQGIEVEQEGPEEPFLSGGAPAENPTADDYLDKGQDVLELEPEIEDRTDDLEDLATGSESKLKKNENLEHNDLEDLATEDALGNDNDPIMGDYDSSDADQYYNDVWVDRRDELLAGNIGLDQTSKTPIAEEIISEKEIEDYYKSQDEDQDEDDEELLAFYASQESEATEYSRAKAKRAAQHFGMDLQTVIDAGNVEEMIYDYEQDVDWAEREASFYGEAKATEFTYPILNDHFTYKSLSQDYLTCNHCGIDILSTYYEELGNAVWGVEGEKKAVQHLKEEHGITEALEKKGWECPLCHVILGDGDVEPYDHVKIHSAAMEYDPDDPEQMIDYRSDKSESDEYDPDPSDPDFLGYINEEITPDFYHKVKSQHSQYTYDGFRDAEDELDKERGDVDYDALEHDVDIQDGVAEEDLAENNGLNTSSNQAGNVFACPDCGFKTHNRDEYDAHNDTHGNIPATVETPLSEENIAVANNDYQLLSRFS